MPPPPIIDLPAPLNISTHLLQVHGLSLEERKPDLKLAKVSSWQASCPSPSANTEKPRRKTCKAKLRHVRLLKLRGVRLLKNPE